MHYYLALTSKCNLMCKYCYGKCAEDFIEEEELEKYDISLPEEINFSVDELAKFAKGDDNFILTFYGGEPLLKYELVKNIMDNVEAKEFMLQTNGIFLDKLNMDYVNRLSTILVSIDGTPFHTDDRRGIGVYEKVMKNIGNIKSQEFQGDIIARMTVDETCDIFDNVVYLLCNDDFKFEFVHWQIDAQFFKSDYQSRNFKAWAMFQYNPKIDKLVQWWVDEMRNGKVHKIYPFLGIYDSIVNDRLAKIHCGAGHSVLGIQTNGIVTACPITAGYKPFYMGDIRSSDLRNIVENEIEPENPCIDCKIYNICSGRCLYANKTKLWGEKGFDEVCDTVFFLVNSIKRRIPEIERLIVDKKIKKDDFYFRRYNGVEIIP